MWFNRIRSVNYLKSQRDQRLVNPIFSSSSSSSSFSSFSRSFSFSSRTFPPATFCRGWRVGFDEGGGGGERREGNGKETRAKAEEEG